VPGPADPGWLPLPLYHDRPETGGFYVAGEFLYWRQTNPIKPQVIAVRGLDDTDGTLQLAQQTLNPVVIDPNTGATILTVVPNPNFAITGGAPFVVVPLRPPEPVPGAFFGSGMPALNSNQVSGPATYQPGWEVTLGWRFGDGFALEFVWRRLVESKYNAVASVIPPTYNIGRNGEDQFLFSPVFNFPPEFAGPFNKLTVARPGNNGSSGTINITAVPPSSTAGVAVGGSINVTATATTNGIISVPQAAYGIWNAATIMSEDFVQRHEEYDLIGRMPLFQNDCSRWWMTAGARHVDIWERFHWRTVSVATSAPTSGATVTLPAVTQGTATTTINGSIITNTGTGGTTTGGSISVGVPVAFAPASSGADDAADYSNVVSNQLYGPTVGCGSEWYLGWGFSCSLDLRATLAVDIVKEIARYEREDHAIANKRARREYTLSPELDAIANIWWYPIEGVELRAGYDFFNFFNTVSSPQPVDFNYGALAPAWEKNTYRFIEGFHAGIAFIF
jgi:hypothetical protein